jgi:hypothetical protein
MDKIIFLDLDGVLVVKGDERNRFLGDYDLPRLKKECVDNLNKIIEETGAKLVLSSDWRLGERFDRIIAHLKREGVKGEFIDQTGVIGFRVGCEQKHYAQIRTKEILDYIGNSNFKNWIAIDDLPLEKLKEKHIYTVWEEGLLEKHVKEAIKELNKNEKRSSMEKKTN